MNWLFVIGVAAFSSACGAFVVALTHLFRIYNFRGDPEGPGSQSGAGYSFRGKGKWL
jgi:hypothetical protein